MQGDALKHREIHIKHGRASERVFPEVSKCSGWSDEGARIEPGLSSIGCVRGQSTLRDIGLALWARVSWNRTRCEGIGDYIGPGVIARAIASNAARALEVGDITGHD